MGFPWGFPWGFHWSGVGRKGTLAKRIIGSAKSRHPMRQFQNGDDQFNVTIGHVIRQAFFDN